MYKILLADDEALEREALHLFINEENLPIKSVSEATTGNMTVEKAKTENPDIIILDINMPGITGLEALKAIREANVKSKVIISTAFDRFDFAVQAMQLGAVDFLVKPVSQSVFIESLKKTIETLNLENKILIKSNENDPEVIKKICNFIDINYSKKISLCDIADFCGYSKFHLAHIFKTYTKTTVIDYLILKRIEKSKELLIQTNKSIKEISSEVGFSDPNYFTWTFKKNEGISPLQFRANPN